jgi:hypothetical protein
MAVGDARDGEGGRDETEDGRRQRGLGAGERCRRLLVSDAPGEVPAKELTVGGCGPADKARFGRDDEDDGCNGAGVSFEGGDGGKGGMGVK